MALAIGDSSALEKLRRSYVGTSFAHLVDLSERMRKGFGEEEVLALQTVAHRFRGSGASYGFAEVSERAGMLEDLILDGDIRFLCTGEERQLLLTRLEALVEIFRRLVEADAAEAQRR